jgi:diguanylate cyclase (GGDEF)-like protein
MPIFGKILSCWTRTGIFIRLFIPIFLLIIAVDSLRYQLLIASETASANAEYQAGIRQFGAYLSTTLTPLASGHDAATIEALLSASTLLNRDLIVLHWQRRDEHIDAVNNHAAPVLYPSWFRGLIAIDDQRAGFAIALSGGGSASVSLDYQPTDAINQIWVSVRGQLFISVLAIVLIYFCLGLILNSNRRMLARLERATKRFQRGEHQVRMAVGGSLEARALATTFNNMADEVQTLVGSLQSSEKMLSEQLTQTRQMQSALQEMSWQNYHDILTGLPNRAALAERFDRELLHAREHARLLGVCLFDLDHFQTINKRFGATWGDEILKQVANRLHGFAGQKHYAAHLGGDEFVLLLTDQADYAGIERHVAALMAELARPYQCDQQALTVSASAGVAVYSDSQVSAETLLRHADQALYQSKLTGRNKLHFFDADLDEEVRSHHTQRTEIGDALAAGQFLLHYQPKVNMRSGEVVGMEALLRWQHPQRGMVGPMLFLPLVDQTDLIVDIGVWVIRQALRQMQSWAGAWPHWVVSVNIAARHFQRPDFVLRLKEILDEFPDVPASMLELEILESSALDDIEHVRQIMTACQELGITFALDDFGTGYSSMSYLKRLPANILKIDQSFVRNMLADQDDLHLVGAIIGLAKSFNLAVIAEGVETIEHGALLMRMGCDLAQGYGIARPMPAEAVAAWAGDFIAAPAWRAVALGHAIRHPSIQSEGLLR